jgi:hypothetical protein
MRTASMRVRDWMRVAALSLAFLAACGDSVVVGPSSPPGTRPLLFEYFIHPGWLKPGVESTIHAGVFVGPGSRWVIESANVEQRGDVLELTGLATESGPPATPPDRTLQYDTLTIVLPPLARGTYFIVAGDLQDHLEVAEIGPGGADTLFVRRQPFAAHGEFVPLPDLPCVRFEPRHPILGAVAGWLLDGSVPASELRGRLIGTLRDSTVCGSESGRMILMREYLPGPSMGDT